MTGDGSRTATLRRLSRLAATIAIVCLAACSPASSGAVRVSGAWAPATPKGAPVGAGYMTIANDGAAAVRLTGGQSAVAERVEIHAMSTIGGVMRMRPIEGGLEVPSGGSVELKPSGMHLMLIGLKRPLVAGESVVVTLIFADGARLETPLEVRTMGSGHGH